jgi:hypothetical protein
MTKYPTVQTYIYSLQFEALVSTVQSWSLVDMMTDSRVYTSQLCKLHAQDNKSQW